MLSSLPPFGEPNRWDDGGEYPKLPFFGLQKEQDPSLIRGLLQIYTFVMQDLNENLNNQNLKPLKVKSLMSRLHQLERDCGELCNLKKHVTVASGHFLGTVKAKVLNLIQGICLNVIF